MGKGKGAVKAKPTRIWSFGAGEPTENLEMVLNQLWLANKYRNALCELERQRRAEFHATVDCLCPELAGFQKAYEDASARLKAAESEAKARNIESRKRRVTADERDAIKQLRAEKKQAEKAIKDAKVALYSSQEMIDAQEALNFGHHIRQQLARAEYSEAGLFWGTYLTVEAACKDFNSGSPPKFSHYTGEGRIVVQLQPTGKSKQVATVADIMAGNDERLRITAGKIRADGSTLAEVKLRVGSICGKKKPIWASFPIVIHSQHPRKQSAASRPLPLDARVTWAWLIRRREKGTHYGWEFQLTLAQDSWADPRRASASGKVGIDVGWSWQERESASGIRVCAWVGSDGRRGELIIPKKDVRRWDRAAEIRGIRDTMFNDAKNWLVAWLDGRDVPEWLSEATASLRQWKSPKRLAALMLRWRDNRFAGDDDAIERLEGRRVEDGTRQTASGPKPRYRYTGWRKQDRHLYDYERAVEEKAIRWRDDYYRNFVRRLSSTYGFANIEKHFIAKVARRKNVEDADTEASKSARRQRVIAAAGRLSEIVKEVFAPSVLLVNPAFTSLRCHVCKQLKAFSNPKGKMRSCKHCGVTEDRDWCAATNLLNASAEVVTETPGGSRE